MKYRKTIKKFARFFAVVNIVILVASPFSVLAMSPVSPMFAIATMRRKWVNPAPYYADAQKAKNDPKSSVAVLEAANAILNMTAWSFRKWTTSTTSAYLQFQVNTQCLSDHIYCDSVYDCKVNGVYDSKCVETTTAELWRKRWTSKIKKLGVDQSAADDVLRKCGTPTVPITEKEGYQDSNTCVVVMLARLEQAVIASNGSQPTLTRPEDQAAETTAAQAKATAGSLQVKFDKETVNAGDKITAMAIPTGFLKDSPELYFSWFLKRKGCRLFPDPDDNSYIADATAISKCDLDGDGKIRENDWKIEAAKIIVRGEFEKSIANPNAADYTDYTEDLAYNASGKLPKRDPNREREKGYKAIPEWNPKYVNDPSDPKHDDYPKPDGYNQKCSLQDYSTGKIYELSKSHNTFNCPVNSSAMCVKDLKYTSTITPLECKFNVPNPENCSNDTTLDPDTVCLSKPATIPNPAYCSPAHVACNDSAPQTIPNPAYCTPSNPAIPCTDSAPQTIPNPEYCSPARVACAPTAPQTLPNPAHCDNVVPIPAGTTCLSEPEEIDNPNHCTQTSPPSIDEEAACLLAPAKIENPEFCEQVTLFPDGSNPLIPRDPCLDEPLQISSERSTITSCSSNGVPSCTISDSSNFETIIGCPTGYSAMCVDDFRSQGPLFPFSSTHANVCTALGATGVALLCTDFEHIPKDGAGHETELECERTQGDNVCDHVFPETKITGVKTGDGHYTISEEKFWGTNPLTLQTANNGKVDEANLVGLGIDKFVWTYTKGDEVGVAVEGESASPNKHNDASKLLTWAFSRNSCTAFSKHVRQSSEYYVDPVDTTGIGILTTNIEDPNHQFTLDKCLRENLIDPVTAGQGDLTASLTATPENPINVQASDPNIPSTGDVVTVKSTITTAGITDTAGFEYDWSIEASKDATSSPGDTGWVDITNKFTDKSLVSGIGNNKFNFKLDLRKIDFNSDPGDEKYIKVKLRITANRDGAPRYGRTSLIIKVTVPDRIMEVYKVKTQSDGRLSLDKTPFSSSSPNYLICSNTDPCPVVKSEILGLKIGNNDSKVSKVSWNYGEQDLICDPIVTGDCALPENVGNNLIFIPIDGEVGESYTITASAKKIDNPEPKTFSKTFVIVQPKVDIVSDDSTKIIPKVIGTKKDLSGNVTSDVSESVYQSIIGSKIPLHLSFYPEYIASKTKNQWKINGTIKAGSAGDDKKLDFLANGKVGDSFGVDVTSVYVQPDNIRKALNDFWEISAFDSREEKMEKNIQVEILDWDKGDQYSMKTFKGFMANVAASLPDQIVFFVKMIVTTAVLLLSTGFIFSLIPSTAQVREFEDE